MRAGSAQIDALSARELSALPAYADAESARISATRHITAAIVTRMNAPEVY
jgi:hypothetical protein